MSMLAGLSGAFFALGIVGLMWSRSAAASPRSAPGRHNMTAAAASKTLFTVAIPALVAGMVTGWPVAAVLGGGAGLFVPRLMGATAAMRATERIEAVAAWAEMLRDSLVAAAGLGQAIAASAPIAPSAIREQVAALAARVESGVPLGSALRTFASEVDDPGADLVVAALVLATEQRAQKLGDLLTSLAAAAREEVSMRLRIESSRSQVRTSVRVVSGFSIGFGAFLMLFAHSYLAPFGTATGQVVLVVVGLCYGAGLTLMLRMARPHRFARLALDRADLGKGASMPGAVLGTSL